MPGTGAVTIGAGAGLASVVWLLVPGYGARPAATTFARPKAGQILDPLIGVVMLILTARLLAEAWSGLH